MTPSPAAAVGPLWLAAVFACSSTLTSACISWPRPPPIGSPPLSLCPLPASPAAVSLSTVHARASAGAAKGTCSASQPLSKSWQFRPCLPRCPSPHHPAGWCITLSCMRHKYVRTESCLCAALVAALVKYTLILPCLSVLLVCRLTSMCVIGNQLYAGHPSWIGGNSKGAAAINQTVAQHPCTTNS